MSDLASQPAEQRRYRILDVIGRGGFGTVYRARLEGPDGFFKDVAIKLIHEDAPPEVLSRFRDEARILGLVRDRAIINVDPPTRLAGRWAVVMEYVDGASAARLVRAGPLPPGAVMGIGEEVARVLHKLYRHPGRDGSPLHLVHRDIKPANLQITPAGEVKLLDFGIARAEFRERESDTTLSIGGTRGYIAPERLHGLEGPEGDVYSLGVVLHKLVTGELPDENDLGWAPGDPEPDPWGPPGPALLALASRMRALRPQDRPTAREVQSALASMRARSVDEPLGLWAERVVPELSRLAEDELVGALLSETLADARTDPPTDDNPFGAPIAAAPPPDRYRPMGTAAGLVTLAFAVFTVAFMAWLYASGQPPVFSAAPPPAPPPVADPQPVPSQAADPGTEPLPPAPPEPVVPAPAPAVPAPPPPAAAPAVTGPIAISVRSVPSGAAIAIDGQPAGHTPSADLSLLPGTHTVELTLGAARTTRQVEIGPELASRFEWQVEEGRWDVGF